MTHSNLHHQRSPAAWSYTSVREPLDEQDCLWDQFYNAKAIEVIEFEDLHSGKNWARRRSSNTYSPLGFWACLEVRNLEHGDLYL